MNTKRCAIGDLHFSGFESDKLDENNLPYRLGLIIKALNFIINYCRERNIFNIDIVGDIHNDKSSISTIAQSEFAKFILENQDFNFRLFSGNHDLSHTGELQKSTIEVFSVYENVQCILYDSITEGNLTYIPYKSNFLETIYNSEPNDILLSHVGINEAHVQSGLSKIDKVRMKDVASKFKLAILGHYHAPQTLELNDFKLWYVGNIVSLTWNDKNESKRFLIYDTETLEVESIPITGIREFKEFVIESKDQMDQILEDAERAKNEGHVVRVRNKTKEDITTSLSDDVLLINNQEYDITNRGIEITQTREEQLKKYLEIKEIDEEQQADFLDIVSKYDLLSNSKGEN